MSEVITKTEKSIFHEMSIKELISQLERGEKSPAQLAEACIHFTEKYNDKYKVWVTFDKEKIYRDCELSLKRIESGERIRNLESVPVGVKDIFNTIDFPTQMGSPLWKGFTPGNDARVIYYLKMSGAIIPGKTDTAEFAVHAIGNCLNPHDASRTPGTSSSGSSVAVALGMVPAAIGTQTAGSIVRPASFCGVYGCKPSFGLLPRTGMLKTTDSLDTIGFFTSTYEDLITMFETLRVHGSNYPLSDKALTDTKRQSKDKSRSWKAGFVKTHVWDYAPDYAKDAILGFVEDLNNTPGIDVTEIELPDALKKSHTVHETIYDKTLSYYFQEELKEPEHVSAIMNNIFSRGSRITKEKYLEALSEQEKLIHLTDEYMKDYDVLISLSTSGEAPSRDEQEKPDPSLIWTLTHLPVICSPKFISPAGLPFGVQFTARKYNDYLLFKFTDYLREIGLIPEGANPLLNK